MGCQCVQRRVCAQSFALILGLEDLFASADQGVGRDAQLRNDARQGVATGRRIKVKHHVNVSASFLQQAKSGATFGAARIVEQGN